MIDYNVYPDYSTRLEIISYLCSKYSFLKHSFIGKSQCFRGIDILHIGNPKSKILFCGGFHGSEYLTISALLKFCEECSLSIVSNESAGHSLSDALKTRGLSIVPCVNPDGTEIALHGSNSAKNYKDLVGKITDDTAHWQANARGVDINHNFDAGWYQLKQKELDMNISGPSPTRFGGTHPESEAETKALTKLCSTTEYQFALALHSQGREIYYDFGNSTPESGAKLARLAADVSGYKISSPEDIATGGGFKDWFIEKFKKPALTVEMGLGKNPLPLSIFDNEYKILRKIFFALITAQY